MMFSSDELEQSNHEAVLAAFDELNYEVRWQQVCPSTAGIPMTRRRIHYQGLLRKKHADPKACMDRLKSVWEKLAKSPYTSYPLADFLVSTPADSEPSPAEEPQKMSGAGKKWKAMHADIFRQHEAQGHDQRFDIVDLMLKTSILGIFC